MSEPISVRGGSNGIEAHYDDLTAAARHFGAAATDTGGEALRLHGYLLAPALIASTPFDPVGAARVEAALLDALDGSHGVTALAARCGAVDLALRGAAAAYLGTDRLVERAVPFLDAAAKAPGAAVEGAVTLALTRNVGQSYQAALSADPELADVVVTGIAAQLGKTAPEAAGLLGHGFADGKAEVQPLGGDPGADAAGPPRNLHDVLAALGRRNHGAHGEIDVRVLDPGSPGPRHVIVDIPGTKDWALTPHNRDITSIGTNLRTLAGQPTSYQQGVTEAMRRAGVQPGDDVLLVGHSEGGVVALNTAAQLADSQEFHVSHVVTAGAPIGAATATVPRTVAVLALENEGDLVPHLDGQDNPDRTNVVTVGLNRDAGAPGPSHALDRSYIPGAADVDASDDPSVRSYLDGLGGFLSAETISTSTYVVRRSYG